MEACRVTRGTVPLLVSFPHIGTYVPPDMERRMTDTARAVPDTDWEVDRLYGFVTAMGASTIAATHSRYVVDVNRPADGASLYPGQPTTGLVPTVQFDGQPIYQHGRGPTPAEIEARVARVWTPYHQALSAELTRLREEHGRVLLWEAHSIRARVPMLFDGDLPDLNIGTNDGASVRPGLGAALLEHARNSSFSAVLNGRFKGGYITRQYGRPGEGIDAVQMELIQRIYMNDAEQEFDEARADRLRPILKQLLELALKTVRS